MIMQYLYWICFSNYVYYFSFQNRSFAVAFAADYFLNLRVDLNISFIFLYELVGINNSGPISLCYPTTVKLNDWCLLLSTCCNCLWSMYDVEHETLYPIQSFVNRYREFETMVRMLYVGMKFLHKLSNKVISKRYNLNVERLHRFVSTWFCHISQNFVMNTFFNFLVL